MTLRAKPSLRIKQPLKPANSIVFVFGSDVSVLTPDGVTAENVGLKAFGLASIPIEWTKPYFVISATTPANQTAIDEALILSKIASNSRVLVRSSGVNESIESRGSLTSFPCAPHEIAAKIKQFSTSEHAHNHGEIHWLVQELVHTEAKGHLSNERRLNRALRDWMAEVELSANSPAESHRIAIRPWRDAPPAEPAVLSCQYRANYINRLQEVAWWAYDRQIRVHFEWVWDGSAVYIVQADASDIAISGISPESLVKIPEGKFHAADLRVFRIAETEEFKKYKKLGNANLYQELGYKMPSFFILDNEDEIKSLIATGSCSENLIQDLAALTSRPLVIRTDGSSIPNGKSHMLPRSDELRSPEAAQAWLIGKFRAAIIAGDLQNCNLCLIAHHFIPAVASAWCQAHPSERRVRIESLWGIPEGLYWYAHDVFDVDTRDAHIAPDAERPSGLRIRERTRFKSRFIAPDADGAWIVHLASEPADWRRSIQRKEWIEEIAWTSRKIAQKVGHSVVVMWFIDIPSEITPHRVLPWYHDKWIQKGKILRAAPREKNSSVGEFLLKTRNDWELLQLKLAQGEVFSRVVVNPSEPEMVRDPNLATALAKLAKEHQFIVELSGGILSHAYYMLSSNGCAVECVDLDDYALEDDEVEFNKLVRDKIPDSISARGEDVALYKLENEALIVALRRKLVEEAFEVMDAQTAIQITEELADVQEVMLAIMARLNITQDEVENIRVKKSKARGSFDKGLLLSKTKLASTFLAIEKDMLSSDVKSLDRTLTLPSDLPVLASEIHSDKRFDGKQTMERQFTVSLPAHAENIGALKTLFSLNNHDGSAHEMLLDLKLERKNSELRFRVRLINTSKQLDLPFDSQE